MPYADPVVQRAYHTRKQREYRAANPEAHLAAARRWHERNREVSRAKSRRWRQQNPEKNRLKANNYRARKLGAVGTCTHEQLQARIDFYGGLCWVCLALKVTEPKVYEAIDHVIPLAKGGSNWPANLRPICNWHNQSKNARPLAIYFP